MIPNLMVTMGQGEAELATVALYYDLRSELRPCSGSAEDHF